MSKIDEIKARLSMATDGPWSNPWFDEICNAIVGGDGDFVVSADWIDGPKLVIEMKNAEFIAHAPDDIAYLLGEVERLKTALVDTIRAVDEFFRETGIDGVVPADELKKWRELVATTEEAQS